ncbi:hypothetical protein Tco_1181516 [Tanacetum coccineum]
MNDSFQLLLTFLELVMSLDHNMDEHTTDCLNVNADVSTKLQTPYVTVQNYRLFLYTICDCKYHATIGENGDSGLASNTTDEQADSKSGAPNDEEYTFEGEEFDQFGQQLKI